MKKFHKASYSVTACQTCCYKQCSRAEMHTHALITLPNGGCEYLQERIVVLRSKFDKDLGKDDRFRISNQN